MRNGSAASLFFLAVQTKAFLLPAFHRTHSYSVSTSRYSEKPSWLDDAMEGFNPKETGEQQLSPLQRGISGFAVDHKIGFVAILTSAGGKFVTAQVSPKDKDRVSSAEALTMVQLAGGLDLGTAILPRDALAKLVADEVENVTAQDMRQVVALTRVRAISYREKVIEDEEEMPDEESIGSSTPQRDGVIQNALPKVCQAVQNLPGLEPSSSEQVLEGMQRFSNDQGIIDLLAFTNLLDWLRKELTPNVSSNLLFSLTVNQISGDSVGIVEIETSDTVTALGLALRYQIPVQVSEDIVRDEETVILERFPAFRPIQELMEDAKIMDGFIPSVFQKHRTNNDMKQ